MTKMHRGMGGGAFIAGSAPIGYGRSVDTSNAILTRRNKSCRNFCGTIQACPDHIVDLARRIDHSKSRL